MSKRQTSKEASLPLFDLPLHGEGEEVLAQEEPPPPPLPAAATPERAEAAAAPAISDAAALQDASQPMLFSPEELDGSLDESEESASSGFEDAEAPLLQDRLLGGLADLTVLVAVLGLVVVSSQLMGVRLSLENWPPFLVFSLLFSFPYAVVPLAFWGQTPGMAWVGHVARSYGDEPLTFGQTTRRWLGVLLTLAGAGLPLLLALGGGSLADRLSGSKTVHSS